MIHFANEVFHGGMVTQQVYRAFDSQGRRKYLTLKEGTDFIRKAASLPRQERLLCEALYFLGCRPSEAIRLVASSIEAKEGVIRIECLKKRGQVVIRRVPVPKRLAKALLELAPQGGDELLWPFPRLRVWRIVKEVMELAGIRGIHACPKGLRHGFGVRAAMANVPIHLIQRWMGHSNAMTTAIYLDVQDEEERKLMARTWR